MSCRIVHFPKPCFSHFRYTLVIILLTTTRAAFCGELYFVPQASAYFDNYTSLDSTLSANQPAFQDTINSLNQALQSILGPTANLTVPRTDLTLKSSQANYKMGGGSLIYVWSGSGVDSFNNRISLTALAGSATVHSDLLASSIVDFSYGSQTAQDIAITTDSNTSHLNRLDVEATLEMGVTPNIGIIGSVRWERVRDSIDGRQETALSQNISSLVYSLAGQPPLLNLAIVDGTTTGHVTLNTYSARVGASIHTYDAPSTRHFLYMSGLLQASYSPAATGHLYTVADDPTIPPTGFVGQTASSWSAGPDFIVGYTYKPTPWIGINLQYRTTVYFGLSGDTKASDPRVNHGAILGIGFKLHGSES